MPELCLVPAEGEPFVLTRDHVSVGRDAAADLVLRDSSVSRRHATIERAGGGYEVVDQKSANGTWLNGQRVARAPLAAGQSLRFGVVTFEVRNLADARRAKPLAAARPAAAGGAPPPKQAPAPQAADETARPMSVVQAAELLGVLPGAPAHEIRRRYHKIYNDYQVRLANAPTPSLRRLYQRNLQEIQAAAELLSPGVVRDG
jgi:hypothetical protein